MEPYTFKKVLFVIDTLEIGGAEQSLLANTNRFKKIQPVICHIYKGDSLKGRFLENGIKVHSLNITNKYAFVKAYNALAKVVEEEKPDLIVGYITMTEIISRLVGRQKKIPVIGTFINDLYAHDYNKHLTWKAKKLVSLFKTLNKLTSKICVGFVANSQAIKEANSIHLNLPLSKIKVINRGRESKKIIKRNMDDSPIETSVRFLNVSRLFPVKGHKELISAFSGFVKHYPDAQLHIAGDGPARTDLENQIKSLNLENNVSLMGSRNDVPEIMCHYDCFVFPSFMEGFSGSVVEAMFAGLPILASDIGPNKEAVQHMQTGYLFKTGSVEELEQAMHWYMKNKIEALELARNAYAYAKKHFELDDIVNEFEQYLVESAENNN